MKLLSICIPTYNRNKELLELANGFLNPALDAYGDLLNVIVCDNSDADKAKINQAFLDSRIIYKKNEKNIGFAGNIIRCANEADAKYIWIISDNDPILYSGFVDMISELQLAGEQDVSCLMLPYLTSDIDNNKTPVNRHVDYGVGRKTTLVEILATGSIPFILLSSTVIRIDKSVLSSLADNFSGNIYLQAIMYLEMLKKDSKVHFLENCVVDYYTEYSGNFTVSAMAKSMDILCEYLKTKFAIQIDPKQRYRVWLTILIHHKGGFYNIKDGDGDKWVFLTKLHKFIGFKSVVLASLLILPSFLFRPAYIAYRSFCDIKGGFSWASFRQRLRINDSYIKNMMRN